MNKEILNKDNKNNNNLEHTVINETNIELAKVFESPDKKHKITTSIIGEISWFSIDCVDFEYYKTFLLLIKSVLEYFEKNNVKIIKQTICEEDLEYFKKSSYVESGLSEYTVSTNIIDFISEMINVLGLRPL